MELRYLTTEKLEQFTNHLGYSNVTWEVRPYHFASKEFPEVNIELPKDQIKLADKIAKLIREKLELDASVVEVVQSGKERGHRIVILDPAIFARSLLNYEQTLFAVQQLNLQMQQTLIGNGNN